MSNNMENNSISTFCVERCATLNQLRINNILCDFTIIVASGETFNVHKNVLAAGSPYFQKTFTTYMQRNEIINEIFVPQANYERMEEILQFIYTGKVTLSTALETVGDLLILASYLEIYNLVDFCGETILSQIDLSNCISMNWLLTKMKCHSKIVYDVKKFINTNIKLITNDESFVRLELKSVVGLLSDTEICWESEEKVVRCAIKWLRADKDRNNDAHRILSCIRFQHLSPIFQLKYILNNPLFNNVNFRSINPSNGFRKLKTSIVALRSSSETGNRSILGYESSTKRWRCIYETGKQHTAMVYHKDGLVIAGIEGENNVFDVLNFRTTKRTPFRSFPLAEHGRISRFVILDNKMYMLGSDNSKWILSVWDLRTGYCYTDGTPLGPVEAIQAVVTIDKKLYVLSKCPTSGSIFRTLVTTEGRKCKWKQPQRMTTENILFGTTTHEGKMYVAGGLIMSDGRLNAVSTADMYDTEKERWHDLPPMKAKTALTTSLVATTDGIYAVRRGQSTLVVELYDVDQNEWNIHSETPDDSSFNFLSVCEVPSFLL